MVRSLLIVVSFLLLTRAVAGERVLFTVSKSLCLLTFLEVAGGMGQVSPALQEYMAKHISAADAATLQRLGGEFAATGLNIGYNLPGYPERRLYARKVLDLISMAAIRSGSVDEFTEKITGLLPNEQCLALQRMILAAEPIYDRTIAQAPDKVLQAHLAGLRQYAAQCSDILDRLKVFYGSTWGSVPFIISLYPVPGNSGSTTATPHSNCVEVGALTGRKDHAQVASVAIHEICHVLFQEQPLAWQNVMDSLFKADTSAYRLYACNYIDEALATACGNAWVYHALTGHADTGSWYADTYIDGFAHAIYPLVASYLEQGVTMDQPFITTAIQLFATRFPNAIYDYRTMLNRMALYTDADNDDQYRQITGVLNKHFSINGIAGSYPISDPQALAMIDQSTNTQLFVVYRDHAKNYEALKTKFPQMKAQQPAREGIISFLDEHNRPVIILNARSLERVENAVAALAREGKMSRERVFTAVE